MASETPLNAKHRALGARMFEFAGWDMLHYHEGPPADGPHRRRAAELVARRPERIPA